MQVKHLDDVLWFWTTGLLCDANVFEDGINESSLHEDDGFDRSIRVCLLSDIKTQVVWNGPIILKDKFFTETGNKGIDDSIIGCKDTAIICVECYDTVMMDEKTWITGGLVKSPVEQALDKMLVPVKGCLFTSIQILFEFNEITQICVSGIAILAKFVFDQAVIPTFACIPGHQV